MVEVTCSTIASAIETAITISRQWGDSCSDETNDVWFRGVNGPWPLVPSVYWKNVNDEYSVLSTFDQLVGNYLETSHYDPWDYYSLARHHGLPTRLLDWTEGISQALFFAFDKWDEKENPVVWMICPHELARISGGDCEIIVPNGSFSEMYLPPITSKTTKQTNGSTLDNKLPIPIYPRRSNPRIHGQQGVFTVHGTERTSIDDILSAQENSDQIIARIELSGFKFKDVRRDLMYLGMRQAVIYPDADHLAKDVMYWYGIKE
ncbi:FRG domain protein [Posidoniimonas corsicana]|uniref:FRG domain protein n=1 Tax=Posidoniimonas corsicana TaxID=1938618 RepID=A0A5C5UVV1_9BACT|nr:FRG domain-containing protein [Posidoniimonas corsicana]TWT30504.1 FRG domain protein [Posidoniimonas corsicana]